MNIQGTIINIGNTINVSEKFSKREFVIEYADNPEYSELIKLEFIQDKCGLLDTFSEGQEVDVSFNLKGRKWTDPQGVDKYFNTLQAWKIAGIASTIPSVPQQQAAQAPEGGWVNNLKF